MARSDATDDARRRLLIKALAAGLFSAGWPRGQGFAATSPKSVFRVTGTVTVNDQAATADTSIGPNAKLRIAKNSELIAILGELAIIVRSESEVVVGDKVSDLRVIKGNLLAAAAPGEYRIATNIATIVQRGKDEKAGVGFYVEAKEELTYFCTCYGVSEISVNDDATIKSAVSAQHHDRPVNIFGDKNRRERIVTAKFKNHTDEELKLIGELIKHIPPFMEG
jgi:hypothetical protein